MISTNVGIAYNKKISLLIYKKLNIKTLYVLLEVMLRTCLLLITLGFTSVFAQDELILSFQPEGGLFKESQTVVLTANEGAAIYYTLDGSTPSSGSMRYVKPIQTNKSTVIRAVAYLSGKKTEVITQSYFSEREYTLPVVSIATDPANFFDFTSGIYVKGCCSDTVEPYMGANFMKGWEKPINIEMYEADGKRCFNQKAGARIFGGYSRMLPQKSLAIIARSKYGNNRFEYPIFPERDNDEYKSFVLRNSGGDFMRTHLRDAFMTQMAKPTGLAIQAYRPAIVYINGEYWGIQNLREKLNEHYLEQNYEADPDSLDLVKHRGSGTAQHGSTKAYKKLLAFLKSNDLTKDETIEELSTFMDIQDYINYNIAEVYSDNRDAGGNIRYWKETKEGAKWRWILFDLDLGLNNNRTDGYKHNTLRKFTSVNNEVWPDPPWSTFIIRSLLSNKKLEEQYIVTFSDHLNTVYQVDTALRLLNKMAAVIEPEIEFHQKRWFSSKKNWEEHMENLRLFVRERPSYLRKFILEKFSLNGEVNVSIQYPGKEYAKIYFNTLTIERDFNGKYFIGVPIKIKVKTEHDYVFKGWENRSELDPELTLIPDDDIELIPLFEPRKPSVYKDSLFINEINFFQVESDTSEDWIELYNRTKEPIDLSGWRFTDGKYKEGWKLPKGTIIAGETYLVLSEKLKAFTTAYGLDTISVLGDFNFGLANEGEFLKLYDSKGFMVDSLSYKNYEEIDTAFSLSRSHIDSLGNDYWFIEKPSPGVLNYRYKDYLENEAKKAYWQKVMFLGGGGFFFILVSGFLLFRYFKKRKSKAI